MTEEISEGPSLIKLGKLANGKNFDKLEKLWPDALEAPDYGWRELLPIAGQVGRQGAPGRAETLAETLLQAVEEKDGTATALAAVRLAADQLPQANAVRSQLKRLYTESRPDDADIPELLDLLLDESRPVDQAASLADLYLKLRPGAYANDPTQIVPGLVETVKSGNGVVTVRFDDRRQDYGPSTITRISPRPSDYFPALVIYDPDRLREVAHRDAVEFGKLALASNREKRIPYRDLKGWMINLLGEKGWKSWWREAKVSLKRDPMISLSAGSQPVIRLLREEDRYEDRLRRKFDHQKSALRKLQLVMDYLDELKREEKSGACDDCADPELLKHFGNGAAKVAMAVLKEQPGLALAGLTLHAEIAGRGVDTARPNPKAAAKVLSRIPDHGGLVDTLPEAMLHRVLLYLQTAIPDGWGEVWIAVLTRAGRRLCDAMARGLLEGGQQEVLAAALSRALERPSASPDLLCWLWRSRFTSGTAGKFLAGREDLGVRPVSDAMFSLLDSTGKLYGMSSEERYFILLENARAALVTQSSRPLLDIFESADRNEAIRLKGIIESNAGLAASQRTQLLGLLRSRYADIFVELTREWEEGGNIYTTEGGLRTQQEKLNHIITEDIPRVAKQIGEAASFGDLSENAEYTAALEMRDQFASTATRLENELALAKVITPDMIASTHVNVGTRVTARTSDGDEEIYTFLGPWDTDTENRVLNYQAPLARAFMGAEPGDTVTFGEGTEARSWEILQVEPAL